MAESTALNTTALNARVGRAVPRAQDASAEAMVGVTAEVRRRIPGVGVWLPPAILLLALWPHWRWMSRRMVDGADEPWGALALLTVLALVATAYRSLRAPRAGTLALAAVLAIASTGALVLVPPLLAASLAMLATAVLLAGQLPRRSAAPLTSLLLLALPLIASLQFYLGYPLRALTAQLAAPLLSLLGIATQASGAALLWAGHTVLVDPPCAGIAMLWLGAYCMALLSWLQDASARRTVVNGCVAAVLVFAANVLRNVVLFFPESGHVLWPAWSHDVVGLGAFVLAMTPAIAFARADPSIAFTQSRAQDAPRVAETGATETPAICGASFSATQLSFVGACLLAAMVPALARVLPVSTTGTSGASADPVLRHVEWPSHFRGRPLTQLPLTPLETRFAARFPGSIARFTDGQQIVIARAITAPTRMLHPAADCFRAAGYEITVPRAAIDDARTRWNCFEARSHGTAARLRVCERIEDVAGTTWTDVSSWYWSALGASGPWRAWTVVTPITHGGDT